MNKTLILMILAAGMVSTSLLAESPQVSLDGLELVEKDSRGELYADPNIDWSVYDQIQLDKATVAFRKNWQRDQNRYPNTFKVKASDMEKIKADLSELFNDVFVKELTSNGDYQMASESGDNVLRIAPQIVDLDVYAPDTPQPGMQRSYTRQAGRMTLKLELYDSVTGDLLATASDRREAPDRGYMQWTTSVSNRQDARLMLERWAKDLRKRLDEARSLKAP
ncbi:MAG: DUF3313 domain-containing protein [Xanthomonadales bacterium]|nr:DUF3313 domain-containing protein [Xanthomonadales bacterium]